MLVIKRRIALLSICSLLLASCGDESASSSRPSTQLTATNTTQADVLANVQYVDYQDLYMRADNYQGVTVEFTGRVNHLYERKGKTILTQTLYWVDANGREQNIGDILWYADGPTSLVIGDEISAIGTVKGSYMSYSETLSNFWGEYFAFRTFSGLLPQQIPVIHLQYYEILDFSVVEDDEPIEMDEEPIAEDYDDADSYCEEPVEYEEEYIFDEEEFNDFDAIDVAPIIEEEEIDTYYEEDEWEYEE